MEFFLGPSSNQNYGYARKTATTERPKVIEWIERLSSDMLAKPEDQVVRDDLKQICKMVIHQTKIYKLNFRPDRSWRTPAMPFSDEAIARIIATTIDLDCEALFCDAFAIYSGKPNGPTFNAIGIGLVRYQLGSLLPTSVLMLGFSIEAAQC